MSGNQFNSVNRGNQYATQYGNINLHAGQRRFDGRVLLVTLVVDVAFFFYGMLAYTGKNTTGDQWRAGIFLFLLIITATLLRRWIRRRV
jgi:hypothetical protein